MAEDLKEIQSAHQLEREVNTVLIGTVFMERRPTYVVRSSIECHGRTSKPSPSRRRAPKQRPDKYFARPPCGLLVLSARLKSTSLPHGMQSKKQEGGVVISQDSSKQWHGGWKIVWGNVSRKTKSLSAGIMTASAAGRNVVIPLRIQISDLLLFPTILHSRHTYM